MTETGGGWLERAACARLDPRVADRLFYGVYASGGQRFHPGGVQAARRICDGCPVWYDCLLSALAVPTAHDHHGVRAGLTPAERAELRDTEDDWCDGHGMGCVWTGGQPDGSRRPNHHDESA